MIRWKYNTNDRDMKRTQTLIGKPAKDHLEDLGVDMIILKNLKGMG